MRPHPSSRPRTASERGMALVSALLLMLVMSALAIALTASGRVEVAMGDNEELYAGARAAAESGLNRAAAQIMSLTANPLYPLNDLLEGPDGLVDSSNASASVNADNGLLTHLPDMTGFSSCPHPNGPCWPVQAGGVDYRYNVRLYDDDDPAMKGGVAFTNVELTAMGPPPDPPEDGTGINDVNKRIVIRATGFGPRGTTATLEQMLTPIKMPALLVDGDLLMGGNAQVIGTQGSVHANGNLEIDGNSVVISQNATATGTVTANDGWDPGQLESGGMPEIPLPDIHASDYFDDADYVLQDDGRITNKTETTVYCNAFSNPGANGNMDGCRTYSPPGASPAGAEFGFRFNSNLGSWDLNPVGSGNNTNSATYYSETDVKITGSPGTNATPILLTIIAEGDIEVTGNPDLRPEPLSELQFVTDEDLKIAGDITVPVAFEGRIMVREQIDFAGTATLAGQVIVQNVPSVSTLVEDNVVTGTVTLSYNGLIETVAYTVSGWRETP